MLVFFLKNRLKPKLNLPLNGEESMRKSPVFWILLSGIMWFTVGIFLLLFGVKLIVFSSIEKASQSFLVSKLSTIAKNPEQAALILVTFGLLLGFIKGRFVLSKTVKRVVDRIFSLPQPIKFSEVYSVGYLLLIVSMILLGMALRWFSVPSDVRGTIDIAVGSALMNGSMFYFRAALKKEKPLDG